MLIVKCVLCKKDKPDVEFNLFRNRRNKACKDCRGKNNQWYAQDLDGRKTRQKVWYQKTKHRLSKYRSDLRLDRKYKLTRDDWNSMFENQKGLCGICKKKMTNPCVDHDHITGLVRGLLHTVCNLKLQSIEDEEFLKQAKSYLDSMK